MLVPAGSEWKYWDGGTDLGGEWPALDYGEDTWSTGPAPLGYGNGDEATTVGYGASASSKFVTTYFRHRFYVPEISVYASLVLGLVRDDGAMVYLNGAEVFRSNMPEGPVDYLTRASSAVGGAAESAFNEVDLPAGSLVPGWNVLAVEVHQANLTSSDLRFDLRLEGQRWPITVSLNGPGNGATVEPRSALLSVQVADPEEEALTVTFFAREALPPGRDFTIIALPDTQYYTGSKNGGTPEMFAAQTEWILQERERRNIVFVTHLGDCAENGDNGGDDVEWRQATNALYRLENPLTTLLQDGIPYGVAVGNHDISGVNTAEPTTQFYNQYFGIDHFADRYYYGGHFGTNNNNHFQIFNASGLDFVMLHLEYDTTPDPQVLQWANLVLRAFPNHRAIVVSHYLIEAGQPGSFGAQGRAIYEALKENANLFLMLCGHVPGEGRRIDTWQGRSVPTLLSDYQFRDNGGDGWLRILEFSPSNQVVRVKTYSPVLDQFETDADSEFTLECDLEDWTRPYRAIATQSNVASGSEVQTEWENIQQGETYQWCVEVSDGIETILSPAWQFVVPTLSGGGNSEAPYEEEAIALRIALDRRVRALLLSWPTEPGRTYRIVYKDDLSQDDWVDLTGDLVADQDHLTWQEPIPAGDAHRFYRVRWIP